MSVITRFGRALSLACITGSALTVQAGVLPGDPGWGTTEPCKDGQFVVAGDDYRNMLISRHTYCAKFVTEWQGVYMDVMKSADGKTYEPFKKSAGRPAETCTLGDAKLVTQFQAYGKGTTLTVPHRIKVTISQFNPASRSANCPVQSSNIVITPVMESSEISSPPGTTGFQVQHTAPKLSTQLGNNKSASADFNGVVKWTALETKSVIKLAFKPQAYNYRVEGAEPADGVERYLTPGGALGPVASPILRCDKNALKGGNQGCAFSEAAAVFVVEASKYPESAAHIRAAMAGTAPGMSSPAPGGFLLVQGTRAVGVDGADSLAMQRATEAETTANRADACEKKTSIIAERKPTYTSETCVGSKPGAPVNDCSCDEYPFASTRSGAALYRHATSAKFIAGTDNTGAGRDLGTFYQTERVLRAENDGSEIFWVIVK